MDTSRSHRVERTRLQVHDDALVLGRLQGAIMAWNTAKVIWGGFGALVGFSAGVVFKTFF